MQVKLKVDVPPDYLRQDMTVSVEIEVARKDAALAVPIEAVHDADAAKPWLWTVDEQQRARHTPVVLGVRGATRVEVVAGLSAGAQVVTVPAPTLVAGQRVRAARL